MLATGNAVSGGVFHLPFRDRCEAGRILAGALYDYAGRYDTVIAAIPRGGIIVAGQCATALNLPLSVFLIRKLGVPDQEELAMGSITSGGIKLINRRVVETLNIPDRLLESVAIREQRELEQREQLYSRGQPAPDFKNKVVILVDDGIATGSSVKLAIQGLRKQGCSKVVLAVPVGPPEPLSELRQLADKVVCLAEPQPFGAVGTWYQDFHQVSDAEVCRILDCLNARDLVLRSA